MTKLSLPIAPIAAILTLVSPALADDGFKMVWTQVGSFAALAPAQASGIAAVAPGMINVVDTSGALWNKIRMEHSIRMPVSTMPGPG